MNIMELREKRNTALDAAKAFLESHRTDKGVLSVEDDATYTKMEADIDALTNEIHRLERQEQREAEMNKPINTPLTSKPNGTIAPEKKGRASDAYKEGMLTALRTNFRQVSNILQEGVDAQFSQILLDAHKLHVAIKVTEELLYDSAFNLENYIIDEFGKALANAEEDAFLNGTGVGQPLGLFAATGGGTVAKTVTKLTADDIINLVYALKRPYRKEAAFIMNDQTVATIRTFKDNNGAYMWQPSYQANEPDKLLGYPVYTSPFAPTDAIAFGDYSYYNIGDRGTRSFKQLTELFAGNGMIGFVAKERVDGKLILPEAVQILKLGSTAAAKS